MNKEKFLIRPEEVESFTTVYQILDHAARRYPDKAAYRQLENRSDESSVTFSELKNDVLALREALLERGYRGRHVAVMGETSYQWITAYMALVSGVGVCVPIDRELQPEAISAQLKDSRADTVFCSARSLKKLRSALESCPGVKTFVVMRGGDENDAQQGFLRFSDLVEEGRELLGGGAGKLPPEQTDPDETAVIIYTSGTTGANKGVMLSNRNIMGTLRGCARLLHYPDVSFSVLPINHSYELHAHIMSCMYCGTTVCINNDLKYLVKNLERFRPEMSCMVPMMLDLIVRKLKKQIADSGKQKEFDRGVKLSRALRKVGIDIRRRTFAEVLRPLGGRLRMIVCGGAALNQDTADFLDNIGIEIYNGYGITECSPVAAVNPLGKARRFSVGHLLPTMEARISDPDADGNGEIQLRGDNVMQGYWNLPEDSERVFTSDGWFRTGDIGHIDRHNFLYISGRLKNLIILPNGKNISPEEIEEALMKRLPYVKECVVYADESNTGIYAICYLDEDFRAENSLTDSAAAKKRLLDDVSLFNSEMPSYKRITDVQISDSEFEKNTTHKIQRFKIAAVASKTKV
ncbi:MAG: AMP-binding protein [Clostridia bacterium]|nr:AMP-binding protein [Clostridia bacterium]